MNFFHVLNLIFFSKENFNLKLRVYFLEEKNPNIPDGEECLYKENIELKVRINLVLVS